VQQTRAWVAVLGHVVWPKLTEGMVLTLWHLGSRKQLHDLLRRERIDARQF
jgi:hypothetical protein